MKNIALIICSLLLGSITVVAQFQKIQRPAVIKKIVPQPQPSNLPPGKDLSVQIKYFVYDPANGGSIHIDYVVRNNGAEAIDLKNVGVQGYIDVPVTKFTAILPNTVVNGKYYYPAGGQVLASTSTLLNGGEVKEMVLYYSNVAREHYFNTASSYTYLLVVDKGNTINESNENNNTVTYTFKGYKGQYQPAVNPSQYYLTHASIILKTGTDNKEKESEVVIRVIPGLVKNLTDTHNEFVKILAKNETELIANSVRTLPLGLYMPSTATTVNPATSLASFSLNGLGLAIEYKANIVFDAWKIEQAELILHFKDANGIYHPTEGIKTILFNMPANTFLDGFAKHFLVCKADRSFNPMGIKVIEKMVAY